MNTAYCQSRGETDIANILFELGVLDDPNTPLVLSASLRDDLNLDSQELVCLAESVSSLALSRARIDENGISTVADAVARLESTRDPWLPTNQQFVMQGSAAIGMSARDLFSSIENYRHWPAVLPHVKAIATHFEAGRFQNFDMHLEELASNRSYSVSTCRYVDRANLTIDFAQPQPPQGFSKHIGGWRFKTIDETRTELISFHGFDLDGALAPDQAMSMIRRHIRAALSAWSQQGAPL